jgi:hypothetical protein
MNDSEEFVLFKRSLLSLCLLTAPVFGGPIVLYDATAGTAPSSQGWLYNNPAGATQTMNTGFVNLDTTSANSVQAGYGRTTPVSLNVNTGFHLRFDAQVVGESHSGSTDRAGFSIIAIGSGLSGIELGFWTDRVFAQTDSPLFTHGEEGLFDTTAMTHYDLLMLSSGYQLFSNGNLITSGALRNYTASLFPVYHVANGLFLGDDTTSAQANVNLALVEMETVPEPATIVLTAGALAGLFLRRRKQR